MRVLVAGGAGYIGSVVTAALLEGGHEVTVLDNLSRGHREAVPAGARFAEVDLLDVARLNETVAEGFDGALHFAAFALVAESVSNPELYYRNNVVGSLNLLDALREFDKDKSLKAALGDEFSSAYLKLKHQEWNSYAAHFTQWERDHTLDI